MTNVLDTIRREAVVGGRSIVSTKRQACPRVTTCALLLMFLLHLGCRKSAPIPPAADASSSSDPPVVAQPVEEPSDPAPPTAGEPAHDAEPTPEVAAVAAESTGATEAEAAASDPILIPRLLLLTRDGPLVIEIDARVDGRPVMQVLEQLVDAALLEADSNDDQRITWDELSTNEPFFRRYLPQLSVPTTSEAQRIQFIKQYDVSGDGRVDRFELPRLLSQGQDIASAFTLDSSNEHRDRNGFDSPLLKLLDDDEDRRLTPDELQHASRVIRARDFNTDDVFLLSDLIAPVSSNMFYRGNTYAPAVAYQLGRNEKWNVIHNALRELYAFGGPLDAHCFRLTPTLFDELDTNDDTRISESEFEWLSTMPAHLSLVAEFGTGGSATPGDEQISETARRLVQVTTISEGLQKDIAVRLLDSLSLEITLPTSSVVFVVRDLVAGSPDPMATQLLQMRDSDQNGYLDGDEYGDAVAGISFADADTDGDEKIFVQELVEAMRTMPTAATSQVHAHVGHVPDVFFSAIDVDRDQRLAPRELDRVAESLRSCDRNGNGEVEANEVPDVIVVSVARGNLQEAIRSFAEPPVRARLTDLENLPRWFAAMDHNVDGDLSPREFLGTAEQFRRLDADGDGYIGGDEALQLTSQSQ